MKAENKEERSFTLRNYETDFLRRIKPSYPSTAPTAFLSVLNRIAQVGAVLFLFRLQSSVCIYFTTIPFFCPFFQKKFSTLFEANIFCFISVFCLA